MAKLLCRASVWIWCVFFLYSSASAQSTSTASVAGNAISKKIVTAVKPLKIGDRVPDIAFENVLNYKNKKAKLSDFKGKLVILDFWATWCASCIELFPKVEGLQKKFDKDVQFITVNSFFATQDNLKKVSVFFDKWKTKYGKGYSVPSAIDDVQAAQLFEHVQLPHYAWIKDGTLIALTSSFEINAENIQKAINSSDFRVKEKVDFKSNRPIYLGDNFKLDSFSNYSVILKGKIDGLLPINDPRWGQTESGDLCIRGWAARNAPLLDLFKYASRCHRETNNYNLQKRFVVEVRDIGELIFDPIKADKESWERANLYTYDLLVPANKADSLYHFMTSQLNYHTKYNAALKQRMVKSWILIRKDGLKMQSESAGINEHKSGKELINLSILIGKVNRSPDFEFPIFDETNFSGKISIDLDADAKNIESLKKALLVYGFDIVEGFREMSLYVVSDKIDTP